MLPPPSVSVELQAIAVFALVMLVANWSDAFSNLFNAFEKMEYPGRPRQCDGPVASDFGRPCAAAWLGDCRSWRGWHLVVNLVQLFWLNRLVRTTLFKPQWKWDWSLQKWMLATSGPLMINHLLATVFWRIDIWILRPLAGAASVGLYSVALKYWTA